jgi:hypothetical protein
MEVSGQLHAPAALSQGKSPWYPLERRLDGPQSRSGRGGEEKNSQPLPGIEPLNHHRRDRSPVAIPTELSRLLIIIIIIIIIIIMAATECAPLVALSNLISKRLLT